MKKYSKGYIVYIVSFIMYFFIIIARPYVTARMWADIVMLMFIAAVVYELTYLIYLRKKDNLKFSKTLALYFMCLFFSLEMYAIFYYANNFIYGFVSRDFLGNSTNEVVYGVEAIINDGWAHFIFVPIFIISTLYQVIYFLVKKLKNKTI